MSQSSSNLDLLRAAAVSCVLFSHTLRVLGLSGDPVLLRWGIVNLGHLGVEMFFIHTSLVLMMSLERLSRAGKGATVLRFYARRAFRIYPLSIFTVLVMVAARIPDYFEPQYTWQGARAFWANLFLVQNLAQLPSVLGPLWSLPLEVQMYLVLPLLYFLIGRIRSDFAAATTIIAIGFADTFLENHLSRAVGYPPLFPYSLWFCMGVAAYALSRTRRSLFSGKSYTACLFLFIASSCLAGRFVGDYRAGWVIWLSGILFAVLLPFFHDFSNSFLRQSVHLLAKYSYGIYLSHVPILWFAFGKLNSQPVGLRILICTVLLVVVPVCLYHFLEEPFIHLGARLAERITPASPVLKVRSVSA